MAVSQLLRATQPPHCSSASPPQELINNHQERGRQGQHTLGPELDLHPSATGAKLLTKDATSSLLVAQGCRRGRAAVAAPLMLTKELTPALLLPSQGIGGDMLSPTARDAAFPLQHRRSGWSQSPWWSFCWFSKLCLSPRGTRFPMTHSAGQGEIMGKVAGVALSMKEHTQAGAWQDPGAGKGCEGVCRLGT